jgi:aminoglycoside 3-N-acetyltransferase
MHLIKLFSYYLYNRYYPKVREKNSKVKALYKKDLGFNQIYSPEKITTKLDWEIFFQNANIKQDDTVFLRITYSIANTFEGGAIELVRFLKNYFGLNGNIVLSSYTFDKSPLMYLSENPLFDVNKSRGKLSFFNEIFRTSEGVLRSIHPTHSVCAFGVNADFIVKDHHTHQFCYHDKSPFARLYELSAKEVFIGVRPLSLSNHYIEQFFPLSKYLYQELNQPIMCRLKINNQIINKKFQVMDQFRSFTDNYDVLENTNAEATKYSIGGIGAHVQSLNTGLEALKELIINEIYWYKVKSFTRDLFIKKIVKKIVLKIFFDCKNGTLFPIDRR